MKNYQYSTHERLRALIASTKPKPTHEKRTFERRTRRAEHLAPLSDILTASD
jgi:hypothetical protein